MTFITETCQNRAARHRLNSWIFPLHLHQARHCLTALAVVILAVVFSPVDIVGAQNTLPDPEETSAAVPFIGEREVWCTERNPGFDNFCRNRNHHSSPAIDIGLPIGAELNATGSGEVIEADSFCSGSGSCNNGAGNIVIILHPDGRYSRYLHMDEVAVSVGQQVSTGDVIGTNGNTGHRSSPHLHFDEQFPLGTRVNAGIMVGCVNGIQVEYPAAFGVSEWDEVPFGSIMVNDGYDCFDGRGGTGAQLAATDEPRVFAGPTGFAIAAPIGSEKALYDISLNLGGSQSTTFRMTGIALKRFDNVEGVSEVRARQVVDGVPQLWSDTVEFTAQLTSAPTCDGLYASQGSLTGTTQADVLIGTDGADTISGRGGNDIICAGGGDDIISAGPGADLIYAGSGDDTISGGFGPDEIHGEDGDDDVRGGRGNDTIFGEDGNDQLLGTQGRDRLRGGDGNDTLIGGISHDVLHGGAGDDILEGRNGRDLLHGEAGTDAYDGGNGNDRCIRDRSTTETIANCER